MTRPIPLAAAALPALLLAGCYDLDVTNPNAPDLSRAFGSAAEVGPFLSSWYFDGRGWGDLYAGTFLQVPVPCSELTLLQLACHTFGGPGGAWTSPGSVYGWPDEPAG